MHDNDDDEARTGQHRTETHALAQPPIPSPASSPAGPEPVYQPRELEIRLDESPVYSDQLLRHKRPLLLLPADAGELMQSCGRPMSRDDRDCLEQPTRLASVLDEEDRARQVQQPSPNKGYSRISEKAPGAEQRDFKLSITDWREEEEQEQEKFDRNRASLLLLEPLLLAPRPGSLQRKLDKDRLLARSEQLKLVRIVIAYTLTFLLLVSITFYVVYFA